MERCRCGHVDANVQWDLPFLKVVKSNSYSVASLNAGALGPPLTPPATVPLLYTVAGDTLSAFLS